MKILRAYYVDGPFIVINFDLKLNYCFTDAVNLADAIFSAMLFNLSCFSPCRVAVLDKVTDFLLFIGKLTVVLGIGKFSPSSMETRSLS